MAVAVLGDKKVVSVMNLNEEIKGSVCGKNLTIPRDCVRGFYIT